MGARGEGGRELMRAWWRIKRSLALAGMFGWLPGIITLAVLYAVEVISQTVELAVAAALVCLMRPAFHWHQRLLRDREHMPLPEGADRPWQCPHGWMWHDCRRAECCETTGNTPDPLDHLMWCPADGEPDDGLSLSETAAVMRRVEREEAYEAQRGARS